MRLRKTHLFFLVPYIPLGIIVLLLRLAIFAHAYLSSIILCSCGGLKRFVLRTMCSVLGWIVLVDRSQKSEGESLPIVSNHVSLFDHLIVYLSSDCVTPHAHVFHWYASYSKSNSSSVTKLLERQHGAGWPVHLIPERLIPKKSDYVSRFGAELFESLEKVQPVALKARRIVPARLLEHPNGWIPELLWQLFIPFMCYSVTYLKPMTRLGDETAADFADRVCQAIARTLGVPSGSEPTEDHPKFQNDPKDESNRPVSEESSVSSATTVYPTTSPDSTTRSSLASEELDSEIGIRLRTSQSKTHNSNETASRRESTRQLNPSPARSAVDTSFDHLIPVVSQILSDLPERRIRAALVEAGGDLDTAIDLLVSATDANEQPSSKNDQPDTNLIAPSRLRTAADTFYNQSSARQASLTERRQALLAHARKRYLVVHRGDEEDAE